MDKEALQARLEYQLETLEMYQRGVETTKDAIHETQLALGNIALQEMIADGKL